ncbi:hypothetical protein HGRIS_013835 [Hohenbuehelia grisea]|uniref:Protein kinase domain-containing protein n=1 Tax=Hohenbuehelia grisea TaxID=104357 RepID=A0ABR3IWP9_9AGAR
MSSFDSLFYEQYSSVECLNHYQPDGFHPVHLGDTFNDGRYKVVHKLGNGTYATVWLVLDSLTSEYASLKILMADFSFESQEACVLSRLQEGPGRRHVIQLIDHFEHHGPNGTHECLVTEISGPNLSVYLCGLYPDEIFPPEVAKRFIAQVSLGVEYLHSRGVVHGDLHTRNMLLHSDKIQAAFKEGPLEKYLGKPLIRKLEIRGDPDAPVPSSPHVPAYCVIQPDPTPLLQLCFADPSHIRIKICDFSESHVVDPSADYKTQPKILFSPHIFRAPEGLIPNARDTQAISSFASDVWCLAVVYHLMLTGNAVFCSSDLEDDILCEMVLALGPLPEPLWSGWPNRKQFFDDHGNWIPMYFPDTFSGVIPKIYDNELKDLEEERLFGSLLRDMVDYNPELRLTIGEVMESDWFVKYCSAYL